MAICHFFSRRPGAGSVIFSSLLQGDNTSQEVETFSNLFKLKHTFVCVIGAGEISASMTSDICLFPNKRVEITVLTWT